MRFRFLSLSFFLCALTSFSVFGKTVSGQVFDNKTGDTLPGAAVAFLGENGKVVSVISGKGGMPTDDEGKFSFANIPDNAVRLQISYVGYETLSFDISKLSDKMSINLKPEQTTLSEVSVVAICWEDNPHVTAGHFDRECFVDECEGAYEVSKDKKSCVWKHGKECSLSGVDKLVRAEYVCESDFNCDCEVMECEDGYEPNSEVTACEHTDECTDDELERVNAVKGIYRNASCVPTECKNGYQIQNNVCSPCAEVIKDENASAYSSDGDGSCIITRCKRNYGVNENGKECVQVSGECSPDEAKRVNAKNGTLQDGKCVPGECIEKYIKNSGECVSMQGMDCSKKIKHSKSAIYDCGGTECICRVVVNGCDDGYSANSDNTKCEKNAGKDCIDTLSQNLKKLVKKAETDSNGNCLIKSCISKYKPSEDKRNCIQVRGECVTNDSNAVKETGTMKNGKCVPTECVDNYILKNDACVSKTGEPCKEIKNAQSAKYECDEDGCTCVVENCKTGYEKQGNTCVAIKGQDCKTNDKNAKKAVKDRKGNCIIIECADEYEPNSDGTACIKTSGACTDDMLRAIHATAGEIKRGECIPTACNNGYELYKGECISGASKEKIDEAQKNYDDARAVEQEKRGITGVATAATGLGGMQLAQGLAEQKADRDALADMEDYIKKFSCSYGFDSIDGGNSAELPGANVLLPLYQEYTELASNLKRRKELLGLPFGIESDVIMDKSQIGLYDDNNTGGINGTYASLYRALKGDENAMSKLSAEQEKSAQKVKTGAITAGAGTLVGVVGNSLDKITERINNSKENKEKIKMFKNGLEKAGYSNVQNLDLSNFDFSEIDVAGLDFSKLSRGNNSDITEILNTANLTSFQNSLNVLFKTK